jgi:hypothetical protein
VTSIHKPRAGLPELTAAEVARLSPNRLLVQVVTEDGVTRDILIPRGGRAQIRDDERELVLRTWWGQVELRLPILRVGQDHGVEDHR